MLRTKTLQTLSGAGDATGHEENLQANENLKVSLQGLLEAIEKASSSKQPVLQMKIIKERNAELIRQLKSKHLDGIVLKKAIQLRNLTIVSFLVNKGF